MTTSNGLREFLTLRRAQIDPHSVGLSPSPIPRRGRGLRREEVAALASVSVDYAARLEQCRIGNVSDQVLTAIEDALQLDALERQHLRILVNPQSARAARQRPRSEEPSGSTSAVKERPSASREAATCTQLGSASRVS